MSDVHCYRDGRLHYGVGIEDTFIPQERIGHRKLDEYELTQHYARWAEDLDLVAESGAEFLRWGIPWYLVEPAPGEFDWSWLDQVAAKMQELGLRCVVDLMHYGTPLWLENSFLNASYPERVAAYARAVAERYREVWTDFTPLNEPVVNAEWCGQNGAWPPYLEGEDGFVKVMLPLAQGMVRTQHEIAAVHPDATLSTSTRASATRARRLPSRGTSSKSVDSLRSTSSPAESTLTPCSDSGSRPTASASRSCSGSATTRSCLTWSESTTIPGSPRPASRTA